MSSIRIGLDFTPPPTLSLPPSSLKFWCLEILVSACQQAWCFRCFRCFRCFTCLVVLQGKRFSFLFIVVFQNMQKPHSLPFREGQGVGFWCNLFFKKESPSVAFCEQTALVWLHFSREKCQFANDREAVFMSRKLIKKRY